MPGASHRTWKKFAEFELWNRGAPYGTASVWMVEDSPVVGVGVGTYHNLFPDYSYLIRGVASPFDNAQSWYRHQLAELGILGSLGWISWVLLFCALLARGKVREEDSFQAGAVKGALVAIGVICLVSMPTQQYAVSLTFWIFAFWFVTLLEGDERKRLNSAAWADRTWPWVLMWLLVIGDVAVTARVA